MAIVYSIDDRYIIVGNAEEGINKWELEHIVESDSKQGRLFCRGVQIAALVKLAEEGPNCKYKVCYLVCDTSLASVSKAN